jgi:hypothetical protein
MAKAGRADSNEMSQNLQVPNASIS